MKNPAGKPPFQLVAGHAVLDLVNTLDWRFRDAGPEELLKEYDDLLRFADQTGMLSQRQSRHLSRIVSTRSGTRILQSTRKLRESLAHIFYEIVDERSPSPASLKTLQAFFETARSHQKLRWNGSTLELNWSDSEDEPALPLWILSTAAADLITSEIMQRLRACDKPDCRWLFLDTSKNHARRWCDMKLCGNRMKARRFKAQHST
jgi:predicted RNA-binding Zn ribbon-like protein